MSSIIISQISFSQTLNSKSVSELKTLQKEAIASENYEIAKKIKNELKTRKTIDEKIAEKNTALKTAVAVEDYEKAEQLQKEIDKLTANKAKIAQLKIEKKTAITTEDYDRVLAIDKEIKALKSLKPKNDRRGFRTDIVRFNFTKNKKSRDSLTRNIDICLKKLKKIWNKLIKQTFSWKRKP